MQDQNETSTSGDRAVVFLRQVAELIAIDNLPAPISLQPYCRAVQVDDADVPTWCKALGLPLPTWEPHGETQWEHARWSLDERSATGLVLSSCRLVETKPAVA